jgi:hypothetical protein
MIQKLYSSSIFSRFRPSRRRLQISRYSNGPAEAFLGGIEPMKSSAQQAEAAKLSDSALWFLMKKMEPPGSPETCCGSGCAVCVFDTYTDEFEEFSQAKKIIEKELERRNAPQVDKEYL